MKAKRTKRDARFRASPILALRWGKALTISVIAASTVWYATDPNKWPVFLLTVGIMVIILCMLTELHNVRRDSDALWCMIWEDSKGAERSMYCWSHRAHDVAMSMFKDMPNVDIIVATDINGVACQWERAQWSKEL